MLGHKNEQGLLIVLSAPSGCGKDTVLTELDKRFDIKRSISMTTRPLRSGEQDGKDYFFVSEPYFMRMLNEEKILEYTSYNGNYYGTPRTAVDEWLLDGETVVLKIEVEGAANVRRLYPDSISIFLVPPSMSVLEKRLRQRSSESEEEIQSRMTIARNEMKHAPQYDYIVVNDCLEDAVNDICAILRAEKQKTFRNANLLSEVINNAES